MTNNSFDYRRDYEKYTVKKSTLEWATIIILMSFSFINSVTLLISLFLLLILLKQKEVGAIKIINLITFRTVINPGVAVGIGSFQALKWIILFTCSIYLFNNYFKLGSKEKGIVNSIMSITILFAIYNIFVALAFSSLPVESISKLMSYIIIFTGTLVGVGYTYHKINWLKWMVKLISLIILPSLIITKTSVAYLVNGHSFQGLTNQPNMFGILSVLLLALLLSNVSSNKNTHYKLYLIIIPIVFYMVVLSRSRTALISCLILVLLYLILFKTNRLLKIVIISFSTIGITMLIINSSISEAFLTYLYKGNEQGIILSSRKDQVEGLIINFLNNPLFGNGFMVPVLPYKSLVYNSGLPLEPGNLFLAVLSFSGIIGFMIFIIYIIRIYWVGKRSFNSTGYLLFAVILINMGEMVFFSSNNIGIWCYMYFALYLFYDNK